MKRLIWFLPLILVVFLLAGEKPVTSNTTIPIWNAKTIGDSIASDTFNTHLTNGKGKFYATYIVTNPNPITPTVRIKIYAQFTNLRNAAGGPIWPRPGELIDSIVAPDTISKQIRILGHLLHRFRVVKFTGDGGSKITMTVEVK
jgi:hypothetical protein